MHGPAFVAAPGRIPAGGVYDNLFHIVDWAPTLVALADGTPHAPYVAPGGVWGSEGGGLGKSLSLNVI